MQIIKNNFSVSSSPSPEKKNKKCKNSNTNKNRSFFLFHAISRVIIFRLKYGKFDFPITTVCRTKNIKILRNILKKIVQRLKNKMKCCTKQPYSEL